MQDLIIEALKKVNVSADHKKAEQLIGYMNLLLEWNKKINLTKITDKKEIAVKHFADSAAVVPFLKNDAALADIGSGAGFPGLVIKILMPDMKVTLIDSLLKRVKFLNAVCESLSLKDICILHKRAEDAGHDNRLREKFDYCTARAVARLCVLTEYCLPFIRENGIFIAMKGKKSSESDEATRAINVLGGRLREIKSFGLPFSHDERTLVFIEKIRHTPVLYPRKAGIPLKKPL